MKLLMVFSIVCLLLNIHSAHAGLRDQPAVSSGRVKVGTAARYYYGAQDPNYLPTLSSEYNLMTPENSMKMKATQPTSASAFSSTVGWNFSQADQLVTFAQLNGMAIRGHNLIWPEYTPGWLTAGNYSPTQLREIMRNRITTEMTHFEANYPGVVQYWDVVNEAYDQGCKGPWVAVGGPAYAADPCLSYVFTAFQIARQVANTINPNIKLFYNDFGIEGTYENCAKTHVTKACQVYQLVAALKNRGLIDGVGFQTHIGQRIWGAYEDWELENSIHQFGQLGVEVHITEMDFAFRTPPVPDNTGLEEQGGDFYGVAHACLAEANCKAIVTWGFTDKHTWLGTQNEPLPFSSSYEKKPGYYGLQAALEGEVNLRSLSSELCGENPTSKLSGTLLETRSCVSGLSQQLWKLEPVGTRGYANIVSAYTDHCMGVVGSSKTAGAKIAQYSCSAGVGGEGQLWEIVGGVGGYQIQSVNSGQCMEAVGTGLEQNICTGATNQIWKFDLSY